MPRGDGVAMVCRTRKTSSHFIVRHAGTVFVGLDCISHSEYIHVPMRALGVCCTAAPTVTMARLANAGTVIVRTMCRTKGSSCINAWWQRDQELCKQCRSFANTEVIALDQDFGSPYVSNPDGQRKLWRQVHQPFDDQRPIFKNDDGVLTVESARICSNEVRAQW